MDEPQDLIRHQILFYPKQLKFLGDIDENISTATRKIIDNQMKDNKNQIYEKYLLIFAFGIIFIVFSSFITNLLFSIIIMFIGIVYIGYSAGVSLKLFVRGKP